MFQSATEHIVKADRTMSHHKPVSLMRFLTKELKAYSRVQDPQIEVTGFLMKIISNRLK